MRALAAAAVLASVLPALAAEDSSVRCAGGIVSLGDATIDLLGKCGVPALREPRAEERVVTTRAEGATVTHAARLAVERWTYDFGPRRFVTFVTLEDGRIVAIARGGYGYAERGPPPVRIRRAGCEPSAVRVGASSLDLLSRCGDPAIVDVRPAWRVVAAGDASGAGVLQGSALRGETWTYDFGPGSLVRRAVLEDGVVVQVDTGGHGYAAAP